ncbi:MAG: cell division protein ZapA [Proteobacteria bacterium]|nr:cell division protein ZapA [Pseudomonadota bacterium]
MNESEAANSYTIDINKKKYTFFCSDGEQHVLKLKEKLAHIIETLSELEPGHILSNYAMKIALLLADDAVREETFRLNQIREIDEKIQPLLEELDSALNIQP